MYLPKSKYKATVAKPGEFRTQDGQQYVGPIIETYTGVVYSGTDPETAGPRLVPTGEKEQLGLGLYNIKRTPTEADYKAGSMTRYFMQDKQTQKIIELSPEAWQKNYKPGDILRAWANITWYLTGPRASVQTLNNTTVGIMEKAMPGIISSGVLYDPLQFYRAKA